jgi:hypothetical protein
MDVSAAKLQQNPSLNKHERTVDALRLARGHQRGSHTLDLPRHEGERTDLSRSPHHAARELPLPDLESPNNRSGVSASKPMARFRPSVVRSVEFE